MRKELALPRNDKRLSKRSVVTASRERGGKAVIVLVGDSGSQ